MIQTDFAGYALIAELVSMPDRQLAEKIELLIWNAAGEADPAPVQMLEVMAANAGGPAEFEYMCREWVEEVTKAYGIEWGSNEQGRTIKWGK